MLPSIQETANSARKMISLLGLCTSPVGVRLLSEKDPVPPGASKLMRHRYCQALMKARRGENVVLDASGISCPAAASAFGFRSLPEQLQSGKGLVGFGIVSDSQVGARMFEGMTRLEPGRVQMLHLFPLDQADFVPEVVVVEGEVEQLMWIVLAYLHALGGERVTSSTAVLQATCVDSTIIPLVEDRLNFSYGCYGCREATDMAPSEAVLGFPGRFLSAIVEHLEFLAEKAIPNARAKRAFAAIKNATCPSCAQDSSDSGDN